MLGRWPTSASVITFGGAWATARLLNLDGRLMRAQTNQVESAERSAQSAAD
jgi:hypothetical protein